jgi:acyl-CoA thioesterase-2
MHRAVLAYASDIGPMTTATRPYARLPRQGASIDHSIWFHGDVRVDDWLLYCLQSPWAGHARGFATGNIYDRAGRLVASVAQEGLMRFGGTE